MKFYSKKLLKHVFSGRFLKNIKYSCRDITSEFTYGWEEFKSGSKVLIINGSKLVVVALLSLTFLILSTVLHPVGAYISYKVNKGDKNV